LEPTLKHRLPKPLRYFRELLPVSRLIGNAGNDASQLELRTDFCST